MLEDTYAETLPEVAFESLANEEGIPFDKAAEIASWAFILRPGHKLVVTDHATVKARLHRFPHNYIDRPDQWGVEVVGSHYDGLRALCSDGSHSKGTYGVRVDRLTQFCFDAYKAMANKGKRKRRALLMIERSEGGDTLKATIYYR